MSWTIEEMRLPYNLQVPFTLNFEFGKEQRFICKVLKQDIDLFVAC